MSGKGTFVYSLDDYAKKKRMSEIAFISLLRDFSTEGWKVGEKAYYFACTTQILEETLNHFT